MELGVWFSNKFFSSYYKYGESSKRYVTGMAVTVPCGERKGKEKWSVQAPWWYRGATATLSSWWFSLSDVKPSNVLINTLGQVKMCDFGISGYLVDSVAKTIDAGCKPYMAVSTAAGGGIWECNCWPATPGNRKRMVMERKLKCALDARKILHLL